MTTPEPGDGRDWFFIIAVAIILVMLAGGMAYMAVVNGVGLSSRWCAS